MPDLDQRRAPSTWDASRNEGRMYCGPTSAANILSYLQHEGYEDVDAPDVDFEPIDTSSLEDRALFLAKIDNERKEDAADDFIAELADEMDTGAFSASDYASLTWIQKNIYGLPADADDYTPGTGYSDIKDVLESRLPADFDVTSQGNKECSNPDQRSITPRDVFEELQKGNLVILHIGYYSEDDSTHAPAGLPVMRRSGGHYVVPTGIYGHAGTHRLWYNDPARGPLSPDSTESPSLPKRVHSRTNRFSAHVDAVIIQRR